MFLRNLVLKDKDNICRRAIMNKTILGAEGLAHEFKIITDKIGLPDLRYNPVTRGEIKRAIAAHSMALTKAEILSSRNVGDRTSENLRDTTYMTYMTLANNRVWMRRARSIKGVR